MYILFTIVKSVPQSQQMRAKKKKSRKREDENVDAVCKRSLYTKSINFNIITSCINVFCKIYRGSHFLLFHVFISSKKKKEKTVGSCNCTEQWGKDFIGHDMTCNQTVLSHILIPSFSSSSQ